ncbi:MAG: hypothetical protein RL398_936 [Planctomycetota bacterium]
MRSDPAHRKRLRAGCADPRKWLPRKDLNLDKQDQNLLCYRYTTGYRVRRKPICS